MVHWCSLRRLPPALLVVAGLFLASAVHAKPVAVASAQSVSASPAPAVEQEGGVRPAFIYGGIAWLFLIAMGAISANDHHHRNKARNRTP